MWWFALGCNPGGSELAEDYLERLVGQWEGFAYGFAGASDFRVTYDYDGQELTGTLDISGLQFGMQEVTASDDAATVVWLQTNAVAQVTLIVRAEGDQMEGHFELNQCFSTDPQGAGEGCLVEGTYDATRQ
ncbi:MAG: hypothetical protein ABMA64_10735 [Myxococcota bacterium]